MNHVVVVTVCGEPVVGLWCDRCLLPSRAAQVIVIQARLQVVHRCFGCGASEAA